MADLQPVILPPTVPTVVVLVYDSTDTILVTVADTTPVILPPVEATVFVTEVGGSQGIPGVSPEAFYDVMFSVATLPEGGEQLVGLLPVRTFHYPAGLTGSRFLAPTAPTADAVFTIKKNGVDVGTFTFLAGQTTAGIDFPDEIEFTSTDRLQIFPPDPRDMTLTVDVALAGYRT